MTSSSSTSSKSSESLSIETLDNERLGFSPSASEAVSDDDDAQPVPLSSIRKRQQYSMFNSWSVLSIFNFLASSNDILGLPRRLKKL